MFDVKEASRLGTHTVTLITLLGFQTWVAGA